MIEHGFVQSFNLCNTKIRNVILFIMIFIGVCIRLGFLFSKIDSVQSVLFGEFFCEHFLICFLNEYVYFTKVHFYLKCLRKQGLNVKNHQKTLIWIKIHQKLLTIAKINCRLFSVTKVINLLCANVLMSAYWFYNYGHLMNVCATIAWQFTVLPIFLLCWEWNQLDGEVSQFV